MEISKCVFGFWWTFFSLLKGIYGNTGLSVDQVPEPSFTAPIENTSAPVGREATLSCSVQNLGGFKVGWMRASDQTVLALQGRVVTHNARYSVIHEDIHMWRLRIRNLRESDRGCYMCQINASPMKKQIGCIDVYVPPDISDVDSSGDVTAKEGEDAMLYCGAIGHPAPRITWRREDGTFLIINSKNDGEFEKAESYNGSLLNLSKVNRKQMGAYLCIASNDVPPAVSKRVYLNVHFIPSITTPKQLFGGLAGTDVEVECIVEAFPRAVNYWMKGTASRPGVVETYIRPEMLLAGKKHKILEERLSIYEIKLVLTVKNFSRADLGTYTCISTNSLGRTNKTIRIYEIRIPTTPSTTSTIRTTITTTKGTVVPINFTMTTTHITTVEHTTELTTTTTEYPTFYPVHGGDAQANQPYSEVIFSGSSCQIMKNVCQIKLFLLVILLCNINIR